MREHKIINQIDGICDYKIKAYEKIILIKDIVNDWRCNNEDEEYLDKLGRKIEGEEE